MLGRVQHLFMEALIDTGSFLLGLFAILGGVVVGLAPIWLPILSILYYRHRKQQVAEKHEKVVTALRGEPVPDFRPGICISCKEACRVNPSTARCVNCGGFDP